MVLEVAAFGGELYPLYEGVEQCPLLVVRRFGPDPLECQVTDSTEDRLNLLDCRFRQEARDIRLFLFRGAVGLSCASQALLVCILSHEVYEPLRTARQFV